MIPFNPTPGLSSNPGDIDVQIISLLFFLSSALYYKEIDSDAQWIPSSSALPNNIKGRDKKIKNKMKTTTAITTTLVILLITLGVGVMSFSTAVVYGQQGQNATVVPGNISTTTPTTNATTMTNATATIITNYTYYNPTGRITYETLPIAPEAIQFQQSDPTFAKLAQLVSQCVDFINKMQLKGGSDNMYFPEIQQHSTCDSLILQGVDQFCTFEALDIAKCNAAKEMTLPYTIISKELWDSGTIV